MNYDCDCHPPGWLREHRGRTLSRPPPPFLDQIQARTVRWLLPTGLQIHAFADSA